MSVLFKQQGIPNIQVQYGERRPGDILKNYSDVSKASKLLNWRSQTGLESGLQKTIDWFLQNRDRG
jgi:UDP-glucose 4-epimerase